MIIIYYCLLLFLYYSKNKKSRQRIVKADPKHLLIARQSRLQFFGQVNPEISGHAL